MCVEQLQLATVLLYFIDLKYNNLTHQMNESRNHERHHGKKGKQTHRRHHRMRLTGGKPLSTTASTSASATHVAKSKHAEVSYTVNRTADSIRIHAKFGDLTGVSAIHIHTNNNGKPGPIIAWLATTREWKSGVFQNTPGNNAPCCRPNNPMCCLAGPADSTPLVQNVANTAMDYVVRNDFCKSKSACPWINNGTILVIHGFNFQRIENGCMTDVPAGIDPLQAVPFSVQAGGKSKRRKQGKQGRTQRRTRARRGGNMFHGSNATPPVVCLAGNSKIPCTAFSSA
jgi:hypothetical protein